MCKPVFILASLVALLPVMVSPAYSTIYIWTDEAGVRNVTNDPHKIPGGVRAQMIEERPYRDDAPAAVAETPMSVSATPPPVTGAPATETPIPVTETPAPATETPPGDVVTQGAFAVQLAAELGLGEGLSAQAAADRLSAVRIAPRLGGWELDAPMTPALFERLSKLTVDAAKESRIPIGVEGARFAFDSAAALARISGHAPSVPGVPPSPAYVVEEAPVSVYVPPPVVHSGVIFVGAHFGHSGFHKHHHGVLHKHRRVGFHKHHHGLRHKHHHNVRHKHAVRFHPIHKHHGHHAKARFKHKRGFIHHKRRFAQRIIAPHNTATTRGHVSVRRHGSVHGRGFVRRPAGARVGSFSGRRMGFGRAVSRLR